MPTALLAGSGEKLGTDPWIGQPFFSGAVEFVQICRHPAKGCHVWGPPAGSVHRAYVLC
jgi:hypothetical protein